MFDRPPFVATAEQKAALQTLSRSDVRGKADRARAILQTLQGWTSLELAEAFDVTPEAVRAWRGWFADRGVDALRSTLLPTVQIGWAPSTQSAEEPRFRILPLLDGLGAVRMVMRSGAGRTCTTWRAAGISGRRWRDKAGFKPV